MTETDSSASNEALGMKRMIGYPIILFWVRDSQESSAADDGNNGESQILIQLNTDGLYSLPSTHVNLGDDIFTALDRLRNVSLRQCPYETRPGINLHTAGGSRAFIFAQLNESNTYPDSEENTVGGLYWKTFLEIHNERETYDGTSLMIFDTIIRELASHQSE